jgi:hypothetical protein
MMTVILRVYQAGIGRFIAKCRVEHKVEAQERRSLNSLVCITMELWAGWPRFNPWDGEVFLFSTVSRRTLGPTQPPIQWVPGPIPWLKKQPGCEADHLPSSNVEVKNGGAIRLLSCMSSRHIV